MKYSFVLIITFLLGFSAVSAQQGTTLSPERSAGVQEVVRIVPELLPQAIRDSISSHPIEKKAEVTSAEQMSKAGNLIYRVNFLKDNKTWSKTYDVNGRHLDEGRKEE